MNFKALHKLFDLENYEGPMLSLFENRKGEFFIFKWLDVNPNSHRWLVFQTSLENLVQFVAGKRSEPDFILQSGSTEFFVVDITPVLEYRKVARHTVETLPVSFLPAQDVFFEPAFCPDIEKVRHFLNSCLTIA